MKRYCLTVLIIFMLASCDHEENIDENIPSGNGFPENITSYNFPLNTINLRGQSPINITTYSTTKINATDPVIHYNSIVLNSIENTSEDLKINLLSPDRENNYILIKGKKYKLQQFHFHHHSEHKIDDQYNEMEIHFVNISDTGAYAVLGVFVEKGKINDYLQSLIAYSPATKGVNSFTDMFDLSSLLPLNRINYYAYSGSLTTPNRDFIPNQGPVTWILFKDKIMASDSQLKEYSSIYHEENFRIVQPLNNRVIYEN
ncbi:carbonic anhydrase family protein [Flavobacterium sp.]|uniref:carbonic anhydrase family protein n=1 Tax=Flavobacterium sp. TaxID=239 RepID=UPI003D09B2DD